MKPVIIIPAYNPGNRLVTCVAELNALGYDKILIINDGSTIDKNSIFESLDRETNCQILVHEKNKGKGAALKTGLREVLIKYPEAIGCVTADADGQHAPLDIDRVAKSLEALPGNLILGSRIFTGNVIPFKSKWGNRITSVVFKLATSVSCSDTQTGLRGIPTGMIPQLLKLPGERFEYEMNMLLEVARKDIKITEVGIKTLYFDDNKETHFNPVVDAFKIYFNLIKYCFVSLSSAFLDLVLFTVLMTGGHFGAFISTLVARLLSGIFNFTMNRNYVFNSQGSRVSEGFKYGLLFLIQMMLSASLVETLVSLNSPIILSKIAIDGTLFMASYFIQKQFVFKKGKLKGLKNSMMKPYRMALVITILVSIFTSYVLVDTFVMPHSVVKLNQRTEIESSNASEPAIAVDNALNGTSESPEVTEVSLTKSEPRITESTYQDENIAITIEKVSENGVVYYAADVLVSDPSYLKTALADDTYGKNVTAVTSEIADAHNALFAVNGDYYGFRDEGYVLRNGQLLRSVANSNNSTEALVIDASGNLSIVKESEVAAEDLLDQGVQQILSFGPALVIEGEAVERTTKNGTRDNPRTAIGQIDTGHYLFIVVDGRTDTSAGVTLEELANILVDYGCETAYNLDGGGTATMWFMGEVVNNPTDGKSTGERKVSDIVYIGL